MKNFILKNVIIVKGKITEISNELSERLLSTKLYTYYNYVTIINKTAYEIRYIHDITLSEDEIADKLFYILESYNI